MDRNAPAFVPGGPPADGGLSAEAAEFVPWGLPTAAAPASGLSSEAPEFVPGNLSTLSPDVSRSVTHEPSVANVTLGASGYGTDMVSVMSPKEAWSSCWSQAADLAATGQAEIGVKQHQVEDGTWMLSTSAPSSSWLTGTAPVAQVSGVALGLSTVPSLHPQPSHQDAGSKTRGLQARAVEPQRRVEQAGEKVALDVLFPNLDWGAAEAAGPLPGACSGFAEDWNFAGQDSGGKVSDVASELSSASKPAVSSAALQEKPAEVASADMPPSPTDVGGLAERMANMALGFEFEAEDDEERMPKALAAYKTTISTASGSREGSSSRSSSGAALSRKQTAAPPPPVEPPPSPPAGLLGARAGSAAGTTVTSSDSRMPGTSWAESQHKLGPPLGGPGLALRIS
eukprot:TRINITY_DN37997_c0_g1_i1.p1 TRINITY_DN37997_c0_g1~~TRINITY_DN37997_c0_g1_i1.p1  ORF type:complete len:398 (+),score=73.32 TRINITY_DN37997_c0_g1_i1:137-1330(+)